MISLYHGDDAGATSGTINAVATVAPAWCPIMFGAAIDPDGDTMQTFTYASEDESVVGAMTLIDKQDMIGGGCIYLYYVLRPQAGAYILQGKRTGTSAGFNIWGATLAGTGDVQFTDVDKDAPAASTVTLTLTSNVSGWGVFISGQVGTQISGFTFQATNALTRLSSGATNADLFFAGPLAATTLGYGVSGNTSTARPAMVGAILNYKEGPSVANPDGVFRVENGLSKGIDIAS